MEQQKEKSSYSLSVLGSKQKNTLEHQLKKVLHKLTKLEFADELYEVSQEYQLLQYSINEIYQYLYNRGQSHLGEKDIKIFLLYLSTKLDHFSSILEIDDIKH